MATDNEWGPVTTAPPPAADSEWMPVGSTAAPAGQGAPDWLSSLLSTGGDIAASAGTGAVKGLATTPGMVMDLVHLAQLGAGKVTGNEDWQQAGREGLGGGVGGSAWLEHKLAEAGVDYVPRTEAGRWASTAGNFAGGAIGTGGVGGLARAGLKGATEGAIKLGMKSALSPAEAMVAGLNAEVAPNAAAQIAKQGITGAGAGLGWQAADDAVQGTDKPWLRAGADFAGALVGGGLAGGIHNLASRPANQYANVYDRLDVTPRFPSDTNPTKGGAINAFLSKTVPNAYGAQNLSRDSAKMTQQELSDATKQILGMGQRVDGGFLYKDAFTPADAQSGQLRDLAKLGLQADPAMPMGEKFNLDKFMTEWTALPSTEKEKLLSPPVLSQQQRMLMPQAQQDLLQQQSQKLRSGLEDVTLAYQGTAQSRALAEKAVQDALHSSSAYGLPGLAGGAAALMGEGLSGVVGYSAATAGAKTLGANALAGLSQRTFPGVTSYLSRPLSTNPEKAMSAAIDNTGKYLGPGVVGADQTAIGLMPDTYQAPPQVPAKTGDLHSWLGSMDRGTATALVSQKLGPQLGQQLAQAGDGEQYGAALMNLSADPRYRQMLQG